MTPRLIKDIEDIEKHIGFPIRRDKVVLEYNESHDECFSYGLCQRFYSKKNELLDSIDWANKILSQLLREYGENKQSIDVKHIIDFYALTGNMYYLAGKYRKSVGYFMKCLSYDKDDITPWVELLFSVRAMGNIELFEDAFFSMNKLIRAWQKTPDKTMNQKRFIQLVENVKT